MKHACVVAALVATIGCKSSNNHTGADAPGTVDASAADALAMADATDAPVDAAPGMAAVTPAGMPIPFTAATRTLGAAGGTLTADRGRITLTVPPGALAASTTITITAITNTTPGGLGNAYRLTPDGLAFATPATLTLTLDDVDVETTDLAVVGAATQTQAGTWQITPVTANTQTHTASISLPHFSDWSYYQRFHIGADASVIHVGDTVHLELFDTEPVQVGPDQFVSVTQPYTGPAVATWNVVAPGNGIVVDSNHKATFTQPQAPTQNPALVTVSLSPPNLPMITIFGRIHILARSYRLAMHFTNTVDCTPVNNATSVLAFDLTTDATVDFTVDNNMDAAFTTASSPVPATVTGGQPCQSSYGTSLGPSPTPGTATTDLTGSWDPDRKQLVLAPAGTWSDFPDYTFTAMGQSPMERAAVIEPLDALAPLFVFDGRNGEVRDYPSTKTNGSTDFKLTLSALAW